MLNKVQCVKLSNLGSQINIIMTQDLASRCIDTCRSARIDLNPTYSSSTLRRFRAFGHNYLLRMQYFADVDSDLIVMQGMVLHQYCEPVKI